jgi:hypothetical protein
MVKAMYGFVVFRGYSQPMGSLWHLSYTAVKDPKLLAEWTVLRDGLKGEHKRRFDDISESC